MKTNLFFKLFIALLFFCSITVLAQNPISRIQFKSGNSGSGPSTSFVLTMSSTPINGNTLVAVISTRNNASGTVSSISQTGATWTRATQATNTNGTTSEIWYAPNVSSAGTTITINQASCRSAAVVLEYSNIALTSPLDQTASTTGNSTTASTGTTAATYGTNELLIGGIGLQRSDYSLGTATNSFTTVATTASTNGSPANNAKVYALEKLVSSTGTATSGGTISTGSQWSGAIATFKEKNNSVSVASSSPTLCINTVLTNITHTTTGATGIGTATGLPTGVTSSWANNIITISGTPTISGTFTYSIPLTGGFGSVIAIGTITVSPASVGGTIAESATVCSGTNSTTLTLSGHTGAIISWESSTSSAFDSGVTSIANTINTLTITNLTATTYYRAQLTSGSCASTNSAIGTITVSPATVGGTIAGSATVCSGTNAANLTLIGHTGAVTSWESSTSSTFASAVTSLANTTTTLALANLTATTYYRAVLKSGACSAANSSTATVTLIPASLAGTISGEATVCSRFNSATLNLGGSIGSIQWQSSSSLSGPFSDINGETNSSCIVANLTSTTYYRAVVNNSICSSVTSEIVKVTLVTTITWTGSSDTLWNNPNNWSCGYVPNATDDVILGLGANQPMISSDISINSLTIEPSGSLTVNSGFDLTVTYFIHNYGAMTVENNANLIQTDNAVNIGEITVKRNSAPLLRLDHTLWSSPVTGTQTLQQFSPNTLANRFYTYTTSSNSYTASPATSTFTAGKGYAIRAENTISSTQTTIFNGLFEGVPNNGNVSFTLATDGLPGKNYNLVGNPYPSTIDITDFLNGNMNVMGTLYFYTHSLTMGASGVFPQGTNYSSRNRSGHTVSTHIDGDLHPVPSVPNGTIQVGQGFLVKSLTGGTVTFTNAMRTGNNDNQFLRTTEIEKHRIWLNLKTDTGTDINQMMVGYIEGATQAVDTDYDGLLFGNIGSSLSSKLDGAYYGIQGRSLPFDSNDIIPLAFKASAVGNYMISLTNTDGLFAGSQDIFVRDNLMGIDHNIKVSPYTFASDAGTFDSRFELVYTQALGVPSTDFTTNSVIVYRNTDWFHVNSKGITMKEIQVFDISGRLIYKKSDINSSTAVFTGLTKTNEILFLKIISEDNVTVTLKVIN